MRVLLERSDPFYEGEDHLDAQGDSPNVDKWKGIPFSPRILRAAGFEMPRATPIRRLAGAGATLRVFSRPCLSPVPPSPFRGEPNKALHAWPGRISNDQCKKWKKDQAASSSSSSSPVTTNKRAKETCCRCLKALVPKHQGR
ncbi:hypothetical protein B0I35DRAFT_418595 [Stachybotrys elegans]|uniref:Uncharacterized protein n=1 Tax=Stachybotrys elegans TaxID=80388 RepID=A0A8K0WWN7_9HYPO|nr:hypothetical protein B0I35DRAFT_418595 [Stachybotrys elegans]